MIVMAVMMVVDVVVVVVIVDIIVVVRVMAVVMVVMVAMLVLVSVCLGRATGPGGSLRGGGIPQLLCEQGRGAGQAFGIRRFTTTSGWSALENMILGYFDLESRVLEPLAKVSPMSPERTP